MATVPDISGDLLTIFVRARKMTMELVSTLEPDDYVVQTAEYTSPPKWHIGHTSWMYEMVMRKTDESYETTRFADDAYLNSYYNQAGTPHPKAARGAVSRPTTADLVAYFEEMTRRVEAFIAARGADPQTTGLLTMAIHHEYQHQELIVYDLQHMLASRYAPRRRLAPPSRTERNIPGSVQIPGGVYEVGHGGDEYCYDIEMPMHKEYVRDYTMDVFPVTCGQYAEFIADGGYDNYRYWLSDGWDAVKRNSWRAPMYWDMIDGAWYVHDFAGKRQVNPREPVCNVSYYEADAYSRWAGKRLPTESEWEVAACYDGTTRHNLRFPWGSAPPDTTRANLLESCIWGRAEVGSYATGASPAGCEHMIGDVWEWTSSEFAPYPGFVSGFDEYNDKWFGGQKVLRGGSSATPAASIRPTYRNFFRPDERWMFAGFRCAS